MIKTRQAAERQQPKKTSCDGEQHHQLEATDHKGRPAIVRPPADIERVVESLVPILDEVTHGRAEDRAEKDRQWQPVGAARPQRLIQSFDGVRSVGLDFAKAQ